MESNLENTENFENSESRVVLIRHAQSKYNAQNIHLASLGAEQSEFVKNANDTSMIDVELSEVGVSQAESLQESVNKLKISRVLVSPMSRTLMTAYLVFCNHPDFENIEFVVYPDLREHFKATCDIPKDTSEIIERFSKLIPKLNTEQIQEDGKLISMVRHLFEVCEGLTLPDEGKTLGYPELSEALVENVKKNYPKGTETFEELANRVKNMKKVIKSELERIPEEEGKLAIVSHCGFLTEYLNLGHEGHKAKVPNCEIIYDTNEY